MGMMNQMPQVESIDPSAPMPQGMMGGQPVVPMPEQSDPNTSHGQYNGVVEVEGKPVQVKAGVANVEGQPYFVSDNGAMIVNHQGQLVGHIENGKFVVVTEDYARKILGSGSAKP